MLTIAKDFWSTKKKQRKCYHIGNCSFTMSLGECYCDTSLCNTNLNSLWPSIGGSLFAVEFLQTPKFYIIIIAS